MSLSRRGRSEVVEVSGAAGQELIVNRVILLLCASHCGGPPIEAPERTARSV